MSQDTPREDQTILAALAALERGIDPSAVASRGDETAETLARLYTEVLGLIPYELDAVAPDPESRQRLLAAIGAVPASPDADPVREPVAPPPAVRAVPGSAPGSGASLAGRVPRRRSRWPLALAASLALVFAGTTAWLWWRQTDQAATIARLQQQLQAQSRQVAEATEEAERARTRSERMAQRFELVTSPAVEILPLRPVGEQPAARGLLFVAPDHQHWYLSLAGLEPAGPGEVYQLWWVADEGPVSGGTFTAQGGDKIELSSETMPPGTTAALVTREPAGGAAAPTGPAVLRAGP